jgi:hypothetical protein
MSFITNFSVAAAEKRHFLREDEKAFMNKSIGEARKLMCGQKVGQQSGRGKNATAISEQRAARRDASSN